MAGSRALCAISRPSSSVVGVGSCARLPRRCAVLREPFAAPETRCAAQAACAAELGDCRPSPGQFRMVVITPTKPSTTDSPALRESPRPLFVALDDGGASCRRRSYLCRAGSRPRSARLLIAASRAAGAACRACVRANIPWEIALASTLGPPLNDQRVRDENQRAPPNTSSPAAGRASTGCPFSAPVVIDLPPGGVPRIVFERLTPSRRRSALKGPPKGQAGHRADRPVGRGRLSPELLFFDWLLGLKRRATSLACDRVAPRARPPVPPGSFVTPHVAVRP